MVGILTLATVDKKLGFTLTSLERNYPLIWRSTLTSFSYWVSTAAGTQ